MSWKNIKLANQSVSQSVVWFVHDRVILSTRKRLVSQVCVSVSQAGSQAGI